MSGCFAVALGPRSKWLHMVWGQ